MNQPSLRSSLVICRCSSAVSGPKVANDHRSFCDMPPALGKRDGPATAILWIVEGGDEAAQMQPINNPFNGCRIEIDQPAKMVLRTGADLVQFGQGGKLRLRQPLDHSRVKYGRMTLHGNAHEKAGLIIKNVASFRRIGLGHDLQFFSVQCPHVRPMLHRQISPLNLRVAVELCDRTLPVNLTLFQHIDAIRH